MKLKKIKLSTKQIVFYSYILIFMLVVVSITYATLFLYKNFYQTISQSEEIVILKEKVAVEMLNMKKFDRIIEAIAEKGRSEPLVMADLFR